MLEGFFLATSYSTDEDWEVFTLARSVERQSYFLSVVNSYTGWIS